MTNATLDDAVQAIQQRMSDNWSVTPIAWPSVPFDPDVAHGSFNAGSAFVYFEVNIGGAFYASSGQISGNLHRNTGLIMAHVFVPQTGGVFDPTALSYARRIGAIFRGQQFVALSGGTQKIRCDAASIGGGEAANPDDSNLNPKWWRRTVTIPFQFDEIG